MNFRFVYHHVEVIPAMIDYDVISAKLTFLQGQLMM